MKAQNNKKQGRQQSMDEQFLKANVDKIIKIQAHIRGYYTRKYTGLSMKRERQMSSKYFTRNEAIETISSKKYNPTARRERRGPYTYQSGAVYEGDWLGGFRDG